MDDPVRDATTFSKEPLAATGWADRPALLRAGTGGGCARGLLSDEHFTVNSTLLEAWANLKSFPRGTGTPSPAG